MLAIVAGDLRVEAFAFELLVGLLKLEFALLVLLLGLQFRGVELPLLLQFLALALLLLPQRLRLGLGERGLGRRRGRLRRLVLGAFGVDKILLYVAQAGRVNHFVERVVYLFGTRQAGRDCLFLHTDKLHE